MSMGRLECESEVNNQDEATPLALEHVPETRLL